MEEKVKKSRKVPGIEIPSDFTTLKSGSYIICSSAKAHGVIRFTWADTARSMIMLPTALGTSMHNLFIDTYKALLTGTNVYDQKDVINDALFARLKKAGAVLKFDDGTYKIGFDTLSKMESGDKLNTNNGSSMVMDFANTKTSGMMETDDSDDEKDKYD